MREAYGKLPLTFEVNRGQADPQVKFLSRGSGYTLFLTATEAVLSLRHATATPQQTALRMRIVDANPLARVDGLEELPGKVNYLLGNDPTRWQTNLRTYARVEYQDVYPDIDLVYYGNRRQLEYDFIVGPGADPEAIGLTFDGAQRLEVDAAGNLILHTAAGRLTQHAPRVYQEVDGVQRTIPGRYTVHDAIATEPSDQPRRVGVGREVVRFEVGDYDHDRPLVIDPVLVYSTYLGGAGIDRGAGIAVDDAGSVYVTGHTFLGTFPATPKAFQTTSGGSYDVFVTKLTPSGAALVYSTYLGGATNDYGTSVAVDSGGRAYVTGFTESSDFPTTPRAFSTTLSGGSDAFVTKLEAHGATLGYSTFLGGVTGVDQGVGIAVDSAGSAYVAGGTSSSDFPTTPGSFSTTKLGQHDAFVTKLEASGETLVYSTFLGGASSGGNSESGRGIAIDSAGNAYVTGVTTSTDFPTTPQAFDLTLDGTFDGFVTKLEPTGAALVYSTFLGGTGTDEGFAIAIDSDGRAYVAGGSGSSDFPTTPSAFDTTFGGGGLWDGFVTKLEARGDELAYSTYLGGAGSDFVRGLAILGDGSVHVSGYSESLDFPTTAGAFDTALGGSRDGFVTTLDSSGAALVYSTYLGGAGDDRAGGIAVDSDGSAYVTGSTASSNFPTTAGAFDTTFGGGTIDDAFVTKIGEPPVPPAPDLVETALSAPPPLAVLKQKFTVTDTVLNQGGAPAVATTTRYYFSVDTVRNAGDKMLVGKRAVPALVAGATTTGTVNVTVAASTKVGVYYLLACADDLTVQAESNEGNNCRASTSTVEVRAPDLSETAVTNPPATRARGGNFSVTDTVANAGSSSAGASTTRYHVSLDTKKSGTDTLLTGLRAVPALVVGATSSGTVTVTIPTTTAPATYYLLACSDDLKKVPESNEKNNCRASATKITVTP